MLGGGGGGLVVKRIDNNRSAIMPNYGLMCRLKEFCVMIAVHVIVRDTNQNC